MSAGTNCLATSLTTAASFLANLASVLQPLREFGFFMGLCVLWVFVLITLYLPPMLVIQSRWQKVVPSPTQVPAEPFAIVPAEVVAPKAPAPKLKEKRCSRLTRSYLRALVKRVSFCPSVVVIFSALFMVLFGIGISLDIRLATGVPQIFPDGHNQVAFPVLEAKFSSIPRVDIGLEGPEPLEPVCSADAAWGTFSGCSLFWCDQAVAIPSSSDSDCWASPIRSPSGGGLERCESLGLYGRLGAAGPISSADARSVLSSLVQAAAGSRHHAALSTSVSVVNVEMKTLVQESWSTGSAVASRQFYMGSARATLSALAGANETCDLDAFCFSGVPVCELEGYTALGNFDSFTAARRLEVLEEELEVPASALCEGALVPAARKLALIPEVPENKQIDVTVLWGIRAPRTTPLLGPNPEQWSFDPYFQMSNPWAQRAVLGMCEDNPPDELRILRKRCWIVDLKDRLRRFPSRTFTTEVLYWSSDSLAMQEQLWMVDDAVVAAMLNFHVDFAFDVGADAILEYKSRWDRYMDASNSQSSATANMAWHTAAAWVMAEAEVAIINSTILTIVVAALGGFACMLLFTSDPVLAVLVLLLVMGVVTGLAFFMVVIMAWPLGPIEVISLVVFVGYSVTYSLHVAHIFGEVDGLEEYTQQQVNQMQPQVVVQSHDKDEVPGSLAPPAQAPPLLEAPSFMELDNQQLRIVRVRQAVLRIGLSTLSSTLSTVGASAFLLIATMQVFTKLGSVVIAVSLLSCLASLVVLPAVLVLCGPNAGSLYQRCCARPRNETAASGPSGARCGSPELTDLDQGGRGNTPDGYHAD